MNPKQTQIVLDALKHAKNELNSELELNKAAKQHPEKCRYYEQSLIPEIVEAYKIVNDYLKRY